MRKADTHRVSDTDSRSLVEFWKQIYDMDIAPDEIPLLKVKMVNSEATFTYPRMCFFAGGDSLVIPAGVERCRSLLRVKSQSSNTQITHLHQSSILVSIIPESAS